MGSYHCRQVEDFVLLLCKFSSFNQTYPSTNDIFVFFCRFIDDEFMLTKVDHIFVFHIFVSCAFWNPLISMRLFRASCMIVMLCSLLGFLLSKYLRKCLVIVHSLTVLLAPLQFTRSGNVRRTGNNNNMLYYQIEKGKKAKLYNIIY